MFFERKWSWEDGMVDKTFVNYSGNKDCTYVFLDIKPVTNLHECLIFAQTIKRVDQERKEIKYALNLGITEELREAINRYDKEYEAVKSRYTQLLGEEFVSGSLLEETFWEVILHAIGYCEWGYAELEAFRYDKQR